jgi:ATP-dependent DNA helicase RecG
MGFDILWLRVMRPSILFPLFVETRTLPGVGPKVEKLIARAAGTRLINLVFDLPVGIIDRSYRPKLKDAQEGRIATVEVTIEKHLPSRDPRWPYKVRCADDTGFIELVFFRAKGDYLTRTLPVGARRIVSGRIERFRDGLQMVHPDHVVGPEDVDEFTLFEPVYRLTEGLPLKSLTKAVRGALDAVPDMPEWLDRNILRTRGWPSHREAILTAHAPETEADLSPERPARTRLAYDELLANQLALVLIRAHMRGRKGRILQSAGKLEAKALAALPFILTKSQQQAIAEIKADMASPSRMLRLLQGDVGSGKTIVAMAALLNAVECGAQGALMAPTEILARQHMQALEPLAKAAGIQIAILTGREKGLAREQTLKALENGLIDILVGTHALFSEDVAFRDLALAVVDEQHRFGVHHRMKLQGKGDKPVDVLVMTATPIPRTLALTAYGDMEVSRLTERPSGRKPVDTRVLSAERTEEVVQHLRRALAKGARAYWVCPLVEESEKTDLAAAENRADMLRDKLGIAVGLVHGRMKGPERDTAMAKFKSGDTKLLVATTVI